jgi:hypothetical protein
MAVSEVAQLMQRIADEYQSAQWGLAGLAYGTARHDLINARTENIGETFAQLAKVVGSPETAMEMMNKTLQDVAEVPARFDMLELLRRELERTEETTQLLNHIQEMWETIDLLQARFGPQQAQKIIETPSSVICETGEKRP